VTWYRDVGSSPQWFTTESNAPNPAPTIWIMWDVTQRDRVQKKKYWLYVIECKQIGGMWEYDPTPTPQDVWIEIKKELRLHGAGTVDLNALYDAYPSPPNFT